MKTATQIKLIGSARSAVKAALLAVALAWGAIGPVFPQAGTGAAKVYTPWSKQGKLAAGISVTGTSAATALPSVGLSAWICNTGANDAYLEFGSSGVAATTTAGTWLKSATCATYDLYPVGQASRYGYVAAITASSTTTLTVETGSGQGPDQLVASGGGGGGGAVTMASGAVASGAYSAGSLAAGSMVDLLTMRQTVAAGTAASNSLLTGGIYNSTPITLTNGQGAANQFDANGYLKVNVAAGGAGGGAITIASGAVAAGAYSAGAFVAGAAVDGWDLTQGAIGDAASTAGGTGTLSAKLRLVTSQLNTTNTNLGAPGATACASDTASCDLNQLAQRIAQNITTLTTAAQSGVGTPGSASPATDIAIGGEGRSVEQTAVTNGQNVKAAFDLIGRQLTVPFAPKALWVQGSASSTDGSAHTIIAAASGSNKNYITDWECSNTSATAIRVTFNDSASTTVIVPAGGGNNKSLRIPLATAAATAFTFTSSSAVSTVYCSAQGFTGL